MSTMQTTTPKQQTKKWSKRKLYHIGHSFHTRSLKLFNKIISKLLTRSKRISIPNQNSGNQVITFKLISDDSTVRQSLHSPTSRVRWSSSNIRTDCVIKSDMISSDIIERQRLKVVDKAVLNLAVQLLFKMETKIGTSAWQLDENIIS